MSACFVKLQSAREQHRCKAQADYALGVHLTILRASRALWSLVLLLESSSDLLLVTSVKLFHLCVKLAHNFCQQKVFVVACIAVSLHPYHAKCPTGSRSVFQ